MHRRSTGTVFLTGDLGTIEADGRIRFRGRPKEMIKTGGGRVLVAAAVVGDALQGFVSRPAEN
jgi:acyl-coenzyme A synthetase/AMP-(fatty) acid ligase